MTRVGDLEGAMGVPKESGRKLASVELLSCAQRGLAFAIPALS